MKLPNLFFTCYTLSDLTNEIVLQQYSVSKLRSIIDVLVIDDENLAAEEYLIQNGFHITHKKDIDTIKDVLPYPVILCDIRGVGQNLGSSKEGAYIIKEIKSSYPNKQVIAYTGSSYDPAYNDYLKMADTIINKGVSIDDWVSVIDEQIKHTVDAIYQWKMIRKYLLENGVCTAYVAKLEDKYVRAIKKKDFNGLTSLANNANDKAKGILVDFASSVCAKIILGLI